MKKFILAAMLLFSATMWADEPSVKLEGNTFKVEQKVKTPDKKTGYFIEIKGIKYPIYKSSRGRFYIKRLSKKGKEYKQYMDSTVTVQLKLKLNNK